MKELPIGSIIPFGGYDWRILDIQNHTALVITEDIIELRAYNDVYKDTTWSDCELRRYLNSEFYGSFNQADRSRIIPVMNENPDNQWYGSKGGEDTKDAIFLLSVEEAVCRYFGDSSGNCIILAGIKGIGSSGRMKITADGQQHLKVMNGGGGSVHLAATM